MLARSDGNPSSLGQDEKSRPGATFAAPGPEDQKLKERLLMK